MAQRDTGRGLECVRGEPWWAGSCLQCFAFLCVRVCVPYACLFYVCVNVCVCCTGHQACEPAVESVRGAEVGGFWVGAGG